MKHFTPLDLPVMDLKSEIAQLVAADILKWHHPNNQICLNTIPGKEDNYHLGTGSLVFDFSRAEMVTLPDGSEKLEVPKFDVEINESDFNVLCNQFKGTAFEEVYTALEQKYYLGRVRLMRSNPRTTLSWHVDRYPRVHYVVDTYSGCFMIIGDEFMHMPQHTWWHTNTLVRHTAVNASDDTRIHLVATIIGEK